MLPLAAPRPQALAHTERPQVRSYRMHRAAWPLRVDSTAHIEQGLQARGLATRGNEHPSTVNKAGEGVHGEE
eukprot:13886291-Alexandrium_andersonii.AAC.1